MRPIKNSKMKESKRRKTKKVAFNNRGRQALLRETTNEGRIPPKNDAVRRQRKHRSREERARTQRHQARRGRGERDTLFYTVFPSFQSNGYDQMKSRSDGQYHTPGSRAFDCGQGRWTLTHFSHGSFCQQSSIQAVANPVCQRFRSKLQQDSFDSD